MQRMICSMVACAAISAMPAIASADTVNVIGGQTSVLLDTETLSTLAGLSLSSVSPSVTAPGNLGVDSVAFGINAPDGTLPTTFSYDSDDFLNTFAGTIEHTGSVFFNSDAIEVGNFTIGFDSNRVGAFGGLASGFFVESTVGIEAILFDIENTDTLSAGTESLTIGANLLVSDEFGSFLFDNDFSETNLAGADVGDALVEATVPAPAGLVAFAAAGLLGHRRRRA